jgi:DNA helicase-2/ATP-dependent DNA helicase PcrA
LALIKSLRDHTGPISEKIITVNKYYFEYLRQTFDNYPKRMRDLDQLADLTLPYTSLNNFLNDMALDPMEVEPGARGEYDSLTLSTIHSSKGLEWRTVILLWACEGKIPSPMTTEDPDELEEERRLVYVATTRAMHNLVIVAPQTRLDRRMGMVNMELSRFFREIPDNCFRKRQGRNG